MNKFKKIMMSGHTQRKEYLHKLYTDRQVYIASVMSSEQPIEDEKVYFYKDISFRFEGTGYRTMEKMVIFVNIPESLLYTRKEILPYATAYEDYVQRTISDSLNNLSEEYKNDKKSAREQPEFSVQSVNSVIQQRNGCIYMEKERVFRLRIHFTVPLINGTNINGKSAFKTIRAIMELICDRLQAIDKNELEEHICLYSHQLQIRKFLRDNDFVAFVGNGSILPRKGETDEPMMNAVPFMSPDTLNIEIEMEDGMKIRGMGIKKGITVITGGGYSGKSTLLDSLEMGIYNHIRGDGREYVIADDSACKIYAEDGRYIQDTDISPFFTYMPGNTDVTCFSTNRASGSVSQATGIIEAIYGQSKLVMIDEDTSATNFMIRDENMRMLVKKEPIIPFTDRISELSDMGISTILVIGGSGEYLKYADTVILMEDYIAKDKTEYVRKQIKPLLDADNEKYIDDKKCNWTENKYLHIKKDNKEFYYSECVQIENARYIKIDDYVSDITKITSVITDEQINSLTYLLEKIIATAEDDADLFGMCKNVVNKMFEDTVRTTLSNAYKYELWLEAVRPLDLLMAISRMRCGNSAKEIYKNVQI